jgi:hypothetical protein
MTRLIQLLCLLIIGMIIGCGEDLNPPSSPADGAGDTPAQVNIYNVTVGDQRVSLHWDDMAEVTGYRVFRDDGEGSEEILLTTVTIPGFEDRDVLNNQTYRYRVAALSADGLEGERSRQVSAMPALFSIIVNDNAPATVDPVLHLRLGAPADTPSMKIQKLPGDPAAFWQPFRSDLDWVFDGDDGMSQIWVEFRDNYGNLSESVCDSIIIDRSARVILLDAEPKEIVSPWTLVTIHMQAAETGGQGVVQIASQPPIQLFDDGTLPDITADDSLYTGFWVVPPGIDLDGVVVTGQFTDWLGNVSPPFPMIGTLSIHTTE